MWFSILKDCSNGTLVGNGICNDETNNVECYFDGGDCCGACINTEYCSQCICYREAEPILDLSCKKFSFKEMLINLINKESIISHYLIAHVEPFL